MPQFTNEVEDEESWPQAQDWLEEVYDELDDVEDDLIVNPVSNSYPYPLDVPSTVEQGIIAGYVSEDPPLTLEPGTVTGPVLQWDGNVAVEFVPGYGLENKLPYRRKEEAWTEGYKAGFLDGLKCKEEDFL
jgi:hypothetical protein